MGALSTIVLLGQRIEYCQLPMCLRYAGLSYAGMLHNLESTRDIVTDRFLSCKQQFPVLRIYFAGYDNVADLMLC